MPLASVSPSFPREENRQPPAPSTALAPSPSPRVSLSSYDPALKITINDSVPPQVRPKVEALVRSYARDARILWLPSRFPRLVMLVEPGGTSPPEENTGSIFESPTSGTLAVASVTAYLEQRIQALLEAENAAKLSGAACGK